jgi:hypothetical protein
MNSKDKTRQKLVDSIRKTKSDSREKSSAATTRQAKTSKAVPKRKTTTRVRKAPEKKVTTASAPIKPAQKQNDQYQSGRRVWPD